jgi:hypothetical protein
MQVADEVKKELECRELFGSTGGRIAELGLELFDLVYHAGLRRTFQSRDARRKRRMGKTGCGKIRLREFDVHEMPLPCRFVADLGRVAVTVPILVRPCRLARDVRTRLSCRCPSRAVSRPSPGPTVRDSARRSGR